MIKLLVPKLPSTDALVPYLRKIESARWATNFGQLVMKLEDDLSEKYDGAYVITTSSCTAALEIVLRREWSLGANEVGFPALTFPATALAAYNVGMDVLMDDVDSETWCGSYVSCFGVPVQGPGVIDAAAAWGEQTVQPGTTACFSMHATKMVGCGEGGYIVTHDREAAKEYRAMTNFGLHLGVSRGHGTNAKMSEYHAAVALASIEAYRREDWLQLYDWYDKYLPPTVVKQKRPRGAYPVIAVKLPCDPQAVLEHMRGEGIECRRWYWPPLSDHPLFNSGEWQMQLPVTHDLSEHLLGLPWHLYLSESDVVEICTTLSRVIERVANEQGETV